jgi:cyclophilin family peptidyl-prolyl cis-trans isomerase
VANFLRYVDDGFYNGTVFHRVIKGFMIQGGGMTPDMNEKMTGDPIKNESANGLANLRGTLAMARTGDPHSATSQFFINHVTNIPLNRGERDEWGYCVFGKVVEGIEVVDAIANVATGNKGPHANVPVEPIAIKSARRASASAS